MIDYDQIPNESPLSQSVTREGKTVRIDIYENGDGGWLLEVVDDYGNSTVWDDSFSSDRDALDEALKSIDEDGIDSLILYSSVWSSAGWLKASIGKRLRPFFATAPQFHFGVR